MDKEKLELRIAGLEEWRDHAVGTLTRNMAANARLRAEVDRYRAKYIGIQREVQDLQDGYEARCEMLRDQWHYNLEERVKLEARIGDLEASYRTAADMLARQRADLDRYRQVYCDAAHLREALETIAEAKPEPEIGFAPTLEWAQEVAAYYVEVPATCAGCVDEQCLDDLADEDGEEIEGVGVVPYRDDGYQELFDVLVNGPK